MRTISWILGLALLAGCAAQKPLPEQPWDMRQERLLSLENWSAEGKLALRTAEQAETASFSWSQDGSVTHLELSGPLGVNAISITSDGSQLQIRRGGEHIVRNLSDAEAIRREIGWFIPVDALPYWLRGLPSPSHSTQGIVIENHTLQSLRQSGWEIHYARYGSFDHHSLPTRVMLRHPETDTSVRLVIRNWRPDTSSGP